MYRELELAQAQDLLNETISRLDVVLWARDYESRRLLYMSEGTGKVFGISREEATRLSSYAHIVHPDDAAAVTEKIYSGNPELVEFRIVHPLTGELRWIQTNVRPETDGTGRVRAVHGISIDVTNRKLPEEIMKAQYEVLSLIALGKPLSEVLGKIAEQTNLKMPGRFCSILLVDTEQRMFMQGASPIFPDIYLERMLSKPIDALSSPEATAVKRKISVILSDIGGDASGELTGFHQVASAFGLKSAYVYPVFSVYREVVAVFALYSQIGGEPRESERKMIETLTHLTSFAIERKETERKIRKLAYYDSLTGLYNRSCFTEKLQRLLNDRDRTDRGAALLYIDLDHFKWVNDSLGHDAGDQLLIEVAGRMRKCFSDGDLLSRIGGDEFAILLSDITAESDAMMTAEKLMQEMAKPLLLRGHECRISLSIGVSLFPEHGLTATELMKHADTAMYQAKSGGRNKVNVYQPTWNDAVYDRFVLQTQFHRALAENQFLLHYQPKIELSSGKVSSVEALIRWKHPELGLVPPGEFISLAEESGYIVTLGEWALREACRQNKVWQNRGFPALRIAVNVSAQQFQQAAFVSKVEGILSETGLAPEFLEIEITESALMNHEERIITTLGRLKRMGVYVSVDDFGTGYSSLNYLKSFEVSALKIDQSFVRDLPTDSKGASITRMIISLAHSLGLEVIGEGVETERQHAFLLENGCEYAQGYLYSRPLTAAGMERQFLQGPNRLNRCEERLSCDKEKKKR